MLLILATIYSCKTGSSDKTNKFKNISKAALIDSIIKFNAYEGQYEGLTGDTTEQWHYFTEFSKRYSEKELTQLCNHQNPLIRCLAFQALADNCSSNVYDILLNHLSDTTEFERFYGCLGGTDRVTDNFLDAVGYDKETPTKFNLTEEQFNYIDSVLLYRDEIKMRSGLSDIELRSRRYMLERLKPIPHFYTRIREIAKAGVYEALPILAKYKNPADTSIFISFLLDDEFSNRGRTMTIYVRRAIRHFPHPSFYSILKKQLIKEVGTNAIWDGVECYPLYVALAQYPNKETRKLFEQVIKDSPEGEVQERSKFIYYAVNKDTTKIFEGVVKYKPNTEEY
ncbi:hypothetical protein [Terrimonas alba]|uniref:hypothetical protein n=1 Tax=Terrimonas alba TaxID=3349636 RepID=UPI0035F3F468